MKPEIGISEKNRSNSIDLLTTLLSDEMTLYVKTRKFHWNVAGASFMELHKLFQAQYTETEETIDLVAERIGKLGGKTIGSMKEFSKNARLKESSENSSSAEKMLKELLNDHEEIVRHLRNDIEESASKNKDLGTADFLTGTMEQHETTAWVLRRYLD